LLQPFQQSAGYLEIIERHRLENAALESGCVVLLGDSLTAGFPAQLVAQRGWSVRGIPGDRVSHVVARLDSAAIGTPCPTVAVLIGSNDVVNDRAAPADVAPQIESLSNALRGAGRTVVIATLPPVRGRFASANPSIGELNDRIRALAARGFTILDLHGALADPSGALDAAYSSDGLHLTPAAYERWASMLDAVLASPPHRSVDR
jgi:lysophospholipase L1-like esterase